MDCVQIIYQGGTQEPLDVNITGEVTKELAQSNGLIFMIRHPLAMDDVYLEAQNRGAIAVLRLDPTYYIGGYLKYRFNNKDIIRQISVILYEFGLPETFALTDLYDDPGIENVTIIPRDSGYNPWDVSFNSPGYYFWTALLGVYCLVNMSLCIWKMKLFIRYYGGFRVSISLFILLMELLANTIRLVAMVDLVSGNWVYSEKVAVALSELSLPFAISSYMLLSLYWHEMMTSSTVVVHPFITKMRIPFFAIAGFLLAIQLLRILLRSWTNIESLPFLTAVIYAAVVLALIIFYIITGTKLLIRLRQSKSLGRHVKLRKTTIKIMISALFLLMFLIIAALFATGFAYYPVRYMVVWYANFTFLSSTSMMNILAFELPQNSGATPKTSSASGTTLTSPRNGPTAESSNHVL
jgi:hypothetical protein